MIKIVMPQKRSVYVLGDKIATVGEDKEALEPPEAPTNKEVWLPSSPDCIPSNYYVWGVTEHDVNKIPPSH